MAGRTSIAGKPREPRLVKGPVRRENWRDKVHPFFVEVAEYQKKVTQLTFSGSKADRAEADRLSKEIPEDLMRRAEQLHDEMKAAGKPRRKASLVIYGAEGLPPGSEIPLEQYMLCWLCWFKYNKTLTQLLRERDSGNLKAIKQFNRLILEFDKWQYGYTDPNKLKFKTNLDHFDLMIAGLDLGIEMLSPEELADCFDELCPCGKEHDPELLAKLRKRIDAFFPSNLAF